MPKGYIEYQDRIGSQHELTTPGNRKSDVVISAIEKCEKLEEENQRLKKDIRYGFAVDDIVMERMDKLRAENQQLKELLKECRDMINNHCSWQVMDRPNHYVKKIENNIYEPLLTKIEKVLK